MFFKRWMGFALAALLVIGIISAVSGAGQRDAWMQGYLAGRLSSGADGGAAAITPYLMTNGGFGPHYGGFGGVFIPIIGLGSLFVGFLLISRRLHGSGPRSGSQNDADDGREDWHERMRAEAQRWHERRHRRWEQWAADRDRDNEQRMI